MKRERNQKDSKVAKSQTKSVRLSLIQARFFLNRMYRCCLPLTRVERKGHEHPVWSLQADFPADYQGARVREDDG